MTWLRSVRVGLSKEANSKGSDDDFDSDEEDYFLISLTPIGAYVQPLF